MITVVLDAYGADYSPTEPVKGAILAVKENADLHVTITGKKDEIKKVLVENKADLNRFTIIDATDVITNLDVPTVAIKQKTESSLYKAIEEVRTNNDVYGLVSGGSTGAVLTGAFLRIGRIRGVSRPALWPILPTIYDDRQVALVDSGANIDCKPINLVHFAIMGNAYVKNVLKVSNPRVALLSNGTEDKKGNDLVHTTFPVLKEMPEINFIGNMEARDLLFGDVDLVVTDGFAGNVLLKSTEGAISAFQKILKSKVKKSLTALVGAIFMKKVFKQLKQKLDYNNRPGAVLLGTKKVVVKAHGSAKANCFKECILQVVKMAEANICKIIEEEVSKVEVNINEE